MNRGDSDFETELILYSYIFKKNIRIYYLCNQLDKIFIADKLLTYDLQNEHNIAKIYLKGNLQEKMSVDIFCNAFEFEGLFMKAYPLLGM